MVDQTACIGDATRNVQYFDHFYLDDINIIANGLSVLNTEVSFTNKYSGLYIYMCYRGYENKRSFNIV